MMRSFIVMFYEVDNYKWFEDTLLYLNNRYRIINADQLIESISNRSFRLSQCHLSFDDGHKSFYKIVMPVLLKHKIPASLFISPQVIKDRDIYWFQLLKHFPQEDFKNYLLKNLNEKYAIEKLQDISNVAILNPTLPIQKLYTCEIVT